jgi:hypothetical protein
MALHITPLISGGGQAVGVGRGVDMSLTGFHSWENFLTKPTGRRLPRMSLERILPL